MIKEFRDIFGISQSLMADYLAISRSQLAMIETGKRSLPNKQHIAFFKLYEAATSNTPVQIATAQKLRDIAAVQEERKQQLIEKEIQNYRFRLLLIDRRLKKMASEQQRFLNAVGRMDSIVSVAKSKEKSLLFIISNDLKKAERENGADAKLKLEIQKCSFEAILNFLESQ